MCSSGKCSYENHMGDCTIPSYIRKEWRERKLSPCELEWAIVNQLEDYYITKKSVELVAEANRLFTL